MESSKLTLLEFLFLPIGLLISGKNAGRQVFVPWW